MKETKMILQKCMQNRELSWLRFNERVLEEAQFESNLLFERFSFLSIFTSNLDEFFMVRVGSLTDYMLQNPGYLDDKTLKTTEEQLALVYQSARSLYESRDRIFSDIETMLTDEKICRKTYQSLTPAEQLQLDEHFDSYIYPLLSPQVVGRKHPFPHLDNKTIVVVATLESKEKKIFGLVPLPKILDRLYFLSGPDICYMLLEDIIKHYAEKIFLNFKVLETVAISVTRNADLTMTDHYYSEDDDFRKYISQQLKKRKRLAPVRLESQGELSPELLKFLIDKLSLSEEQVFQCSCPLDLKYCYNLRNKLPTNILYKYINMPFTPKNISLKKHETCLNRVIKGDILLAYPFEGMDFFLSLIKEAARDTSVVSIQITLYRVAKQSKLAEALKEAAENGKSVNVLIELRARMDEAHNVEMANRLEEAGCRVIYGEDEYKNHSKICLITRIDEGAVQYITHIGTGNYNEKTAKEYTDLSLITADQRIGADGARFFKNMLIGNITDTYDYLWVAPVSYKYNLLAAIKNEQHKAETGLPARIIIKNNALNDTDIMIALIEASQAGVKIDLIIRGICCLIPKIPDYTENITVRSIIGRFLEHSRIYSFGEGDDQKVYIGSADMLTRNTERRVEILSPILNEDLQQRVIRMLNIILSDNTKTREQNAEGKYHLIKTEGEPINSQQVLLTNPEAL